MTFDLPVLIKCPSCREIYVRESLASMTYVTRHAWSDGYTECDGTHPGESSVIVECRACRSWHRAEDGVVIAELPWHIVPHSVPSASLHVPLKREQLEAALDQEWDRETERVLRTQLLWAQNHERREADPLPPVRAELMENLERLADLVDSDADPLFAAEVHRQMGDFAAAQSIIERAIGAEGAAVEADTDDGSDRVHFLKQIGERVAQERIEPFVYTFPEEPREPITPERLKQILDEEGLYPRPPIEDVFAFPTEARQRNEDPALQIRLDTCDPNWSGWAPMLDTKKTSHILRFNRLFTESDWELYERAIPEWKRELEWFWSQWSFLIDPNHPDSSRYYRTLYMLYYEQFIPESDFGFDMDTASFAEDFDAYYHAEGAPAGYYLMFWNMYWAQLSGRLDGSLFVSVDLAGEFEELHEHLHELRVTQQEAIEGLDYVERGDPRWFQGLDLTPTVGERPCEFVAQVWLDYINAGFSLVYLFYDPESRTVHQVYDYD